MEQIQYIIDLLENGHHEKAKQEYEIILVNGTDEEKFTLGEELMQLGFVLEAKNLFEALLEKYPNEGELLILIAEACIDLGEEEEAVLLLERVEEDDPSYVESLMLLADLYQMEGLYEVSERKLKQAKEALPNEIVIDFALGELFLSQGKFLEAIRAFEEVLKVQTEIAGVNVHQRMAEALSAGGAFEDALPHYEKALDDQLEINTLFGYAFTALQADKNQLAIEKFQELKELDPEYHSLYLYLAKAYEREDELKQSLDAVIEGIKRDDFNKDLLFYGGKLSLKLGDEEQAEKLLRESIVVDPEFLEAALTLNKLLLKQERYEDVIEIVKDLERSNEEDPQLDWDAAIAFQQLEMYSEALNKYELAYTFFKNHQDFLKDYGYFLIEEGKHTEAAEIFNKLLLDDPSNDEYLQILERLTEE